VATKLSYKEQRELDELPARQAALQAELGKLEQALADPALYARDAAQFAKVTDRLETVRAELAAAEERWLELEMKREELAAGGGPKA
jgi:ATP-binding cassette subfamily F protein uup